MLIEEDLAKLISEKKAMNAERERKQRLRSEAFHMRICPDCGSHKVICKIGFFLGGEKYICLDCSSSLTEYSMY